MGKEGVNPAFFHVEGPPFQGIEYRLADLERDAGAIASLFNQPHAIEHLSGIAPAVTPPNLDVRKFGKKNPQYNVLIATEEELRRFYIEHTGLVPIVAVNKSGKVVGTVTSEKPSGLGLTYGGVSRLIVDKEERRKGIGKGLVRSATAYGLFKLLCPAVHAGIIIGVEGDNTPLRIFREEGFTFMHQATGNCVSWSNEKNKFVIRNTHYVRLLVHDAQPRRADLNRYLPQAA